MDSDDGVTDTLLARVTAGADGAPAVAVAIGPLDVAPDDHVVWVGDVVAGPAEAVAAAVVRVEGGRATVRAAAAPAALVGRLAAEVGALASGRGCTEVAVGDGGGGARAVVERLGLRPEGPDLWALDP